MGIVIILKLREGEPGTFEGGPNVTAANASRTRCTLLDGRSACPVPASPQRPDNPAVGCDRSPARLGPAAAARSLIPLRRCPWAGLPPLPRAYPWLDGRPDMKIKIRQHHGSTPQED